MLREMGPQETFWKEMQEVMYLKFLHQDKEIPADFSQRMSNLMHVCKAEFNFPYYSILSTTSGLDF